VPEIIRPRDTNEEEDATGTRLRLRLLATSDIHANVLAYDYYRDRTDDTVGLVRTASLVEAARREVNNCLLFDNGDFLQGAPMADLAAFGDWSRHDGTHPVIAAMNLLGYDAAVIGNHEFNYGLDFLRRAVAGATFPLLSANVTLSSHGPSPLSDDTLVQPSLLVERAFADEAGTMHRLRIGIIGFTPPQILQWDDAHLRGIVGTRGILETAAARVPALRALGADIVIALAHTGIGHPDATDADENVALRLAGVPGIDAIVAGHSHELFPAGPEPEAGVDVAHGTLNGVPAVMPGFGGSHLGVIDLELRLRAGHWQVEGHRVQLRPIAVRHAVDVEPQVADEPRIFANAQAAHRATLAYMAQPVGRSAVRLHSYFAMIGDTAVTTLVAQAQLWYAQPLLRGENARLPLLSAVAPFKAGGRGGPGAFTDVPAGDIALKNVADIYAYPNTIMVVRVTGAQLRDWLERSAGAYRRVAAGNQEQPLLEAQFAPYNFDIIKGVSYRIDVSQPAKFDLEGRLTEPAARRVRDLTFAGRAVLDNEHFCVVTNSYRANGGGAFPGIDGSNVIVSAPDYARDVLCRYLAAVPEVAPLPDRNWALAPVPGAGFVTVDSSPSARDVLDETPGVTATGPAEGGFWRYRIDLASAA